MALHLKCHVTLSLYFFGQSTLVAHAIPRCIIGFYKLKENNINQKAHAFHLEHVGLVIESKGHLTSSYLGRQKSQRKENALDKSIKQQSDDSLRVVLTLEIPVSLSEDSLVRSGNIRNSQLSR